MGAQDIAEHHRLPVLNLVDCGGAHIPALSAEVVMDRGQARIHLASFRPA